MEQSKNQQQTQPTMKCGTEPELNPGHIGESEHSHHCAIPVPSLTLSIEVYISQDTSIYTLNIDHGLLLRLMV